MSDRDKEAEILGARLAILEDALIPMARIYRPGAIEIYERECDDLRRMIIRSDAAIATSDEADVCEVARDAEIEGRIDLAIEILKQAPNRLARRCPMCGAWPGTQCKTMPAEDGAKRCTCPSFASCDDIAAAPQPGHACPGCGATSERLLVPHRARLDPAAGEIVRP